MSRESEIAAVTAALEQLMAELGGNVADLRAILATTPEASGEQPAPA